MRIVEESPSLNMFGEDAEEKADQDIIINSEASMALLEENKKNVPEEDHKQGVEVVQIQNSNISASEPKNVSILGAHLSLFNNPNILL